jgi:hypothetical protein
VVHAGARVEENGVAGDEVEERHGASDPAGRSSSGSRAKGASSSLAPFQPRRPLTLEDVQGWRFDCCPHPLMLLQRQGLGRPEHAVFVDGFDSQGHGRDP